MLPICYGVAAWDLSRDPPIANRLGWLLDPVSKQVHIYRPEAKPGILDNPAEISGAPVLPNFRLDVPKIWAAINRAA